jgi:hypothetical protein
LRPLQRRRLGESGRSLNRRGNPKVLEATAAIFAC